MSISFTGNYLYSFYDSNRANKFKTAIGTKANIRECHANGNNVLVLSGQDMVDFHNAYADIDEVAVGKSDKDYMIGQLWKGFAQKSIKVDCSQGDSAEFLNLKTYI